MIDKARLSWEFPQIVRFELSRATCTQCGRPSIGPVDYCFRSETAVRVNLDCKSAPGLDPILMPAVAVTEVLRAQSFALSSGQHLKKHRDKLKPEVVWN